MNWLPREPPKNPNVMSSKFYLADGEWVAADYVAEKQLWGDHLVRYMCEQAGIEDATVMTFDTWILAHNTLHGLWITNADKKAVYDIRVNKGTCYVGNRIAMGNMTGKPNDIMMIIASKGHGFDCTATAVTPLQYFSTRLGTRDEVGCNWRTIKKLEDKKGCRHGSNDFSPESRFNFFLLAIKDPRYQQPMLKPEEDTTECTFVVDATVVPNEDNANAIDMLVQAAEQTDQKPRKPAAQRPRTSRAETRSAAQSGNAINGLPGTQTLLCAVRCPLDHNKIAGGQILEKGELNIYDRVSLNATGTGFMAKCANGRSITCSTPERAAIYSAVTFEDFDVVNDPNNSPEHKGVSPGKRTREEMQQPEMQQQPVDMSLEEAKQKLHELNEKKCQVLQAITPQAEELKARLEELTSLPPDFPEAQQINALNAVLANFKEGDAGFTDLNNAKKKMQASLDQKEAEQQGEIQEIKKQLQKYIELGVVL